MTADGIVDTADQHALAEGQLYDLIERDKKLQKVMASYGASRHDLRNIYHMLLKAGAGQWAQGHWVAASTLAFGTSLDFVLSNTQNGEKAGRDLWNHVAFALIEYFEKEKMGSIHF